MVAAITDLSFFDRRKLDAFTSYRNPKLHPKPLALKYTQSSATKLTWT